MKIVLLDFLDEDLLKVLLSENVVYRPDLAWKSRSIMVAALRKSGASAIVTRSPPSDEVLSLWGTDREVCLVLVTVGDCGSGLEPIVVRGSGIDRFTVEGRDQPTAYKAALDLLERRSTATFREEVTRTAPFKAGAAERTVTLVGAGIVNLVTGYQLHQKGYDVRIIEAGPDPSDDTPWTAHGCSFGGDDARMFTLSEMDNYNDKAVSPGMNGIFNKSVCDLGWGARSRTSLTSAEQAWISEYESVPVWLAEVYNRDVFALNRESGSLWRGLTEDDPDLFSGCEFREGILRIYADADHLESALRRQTRIGAVKRVLTPADVAAFQPALSEAVAHGEIAGGILVVGVTVNVHKFMHRIIRRMSAGGARFDWGCRVRGLRIDASGRIEGLETDSGSMEGCNFVLSPGAYGRDILTGTRSHEKIHGVLGAWLRLPNLEPRLDQSLKLARRNHVTEDANITVATDRTGRPIMIIGSGYGHTGIDPMNVDPAMLHAIYAGLADTARRFFPTAYGEARASGLAEISLKYCVRPWTATGLGLFEIMGTSSGGRGVITGGHNTGGFAQAPVIARAVIDALEGRNHQMHELYHPDRASRFMSASSPRPMIETRGTVATPFADASSFAQCETAASKRYGQKVWAEGRR